MRQKSVDHHIIQISVGPIKTSWFQTDLFEISDLKLGMVIHRENGHKDDNVIRI